MKRLIAAIIAVLVLVPAAFFMCHCCPVMTSQKILEIKAARCHGCCTESIEVAKDCAIIKNQTPQSIAPSKLLSVIAALLPEARITVPVEASALNSQFKSPPQVALPALSIVLRI